jgi:hypothetical protein
MMTFLLNPLQLHAFLMHMFDVHMQVLKMLDEFNNREEDVKCFAQTRVVNADGIC